jgi:hypothetical protein
MPDMLVFYRGKCMGIELKVEGAAPSSVQRTTFAQLQAAGVPIYVCRSISDVIEALNRCRVPFRYTSEINHETNRPSYRHSDPTVLDAG